MLTCKKCGETKDKECFTVRLTSRRGYAAKCKPCRAREQRLLNAGDTSHANEVSKPSRRRLDPAVRKQRHKAWQDKNKNWQKNYDLIRHYGITLEQREQMLEQQNGLCAICKKPGKLVVDHNHTSRKVRGLLHQNCNVALGLFHENFDALLNAAKYIQEHEGVL